MPLLPAMTTAVQATSNGVAFALEVDSGSADTSTRPESSSDFMIPPRVV